MLGSLKCRSTNSEITAKYDKFHEKMGNADKYNNALKLRFMRENGIADGQRAYDDFITRLDNSHSDGVQTAGFCKMAATLLSLATDRKSVVLGKGVSVRVNLGGRRSGKKKK